MLVPGTDTLFTRFRWVPAIQGEDVAFVADGIGPFARVDGQLVNIADRQTIQPGAGGTLRTFSIYAPISRPAVFTQALYQYSDRFVSYED